MIGEKSTLFSESRQQLFELNESATYLAARLEEGVTARELISDFVESGVESESAAKMIADLLVSWSQQGIVAAAANPWPDRSLRQDLSIGGIEISVGYSTPELQARIAPVFRHLEAPASGKQDRYSIVEADGCTLIGKDDEPAIIVHHEQAVPALKAALFQHVIETADSLASLHTACLVKGAKAMLLGGAPGAGKSTLTLALMSAGLDYASDDVTLLLRDGKVRGIPFAPTAKEGSWPLLEQIGYRLSDAPIHRRLDDVRVRYLPPHATACGEAVRVGWFIVLIREENAEPTLARRTTVEALGSLLEEGFAPSRRASVDCLRALSDMLARVECYEFRYSDLSDAASALNELIRDA